MKSRALWHTSPVNSEIQEQEIPEESGDKVLIRTLFSQISMGTERMVALGMVPAEIQAQMEVPYMDGSFSLPCKYGYSLVGEVLRGPVHQQGKIVHVMHPHQDLAWVDKSSLYPIPEGIPLQRALLACNLETAVNALWDSEISMGDRILIAGFGLIGALIAILASWIPGAKVAVLEKNEIRQKLALQFGFEVIRKAQPTGQFFDAAFNTTSDEQALQFCIDNIGFESQVTEVSFYGKKGVTVLPGGSFHVGRKRIVSSQVSSIPGKKQGRWDKIRRKDLVFDLLRSDRFDSLAGRITPFSEAPALFSRIRNGSLNEISVVINYQ